VAVSSFMIQPTQCRNACSDGLSMKVSN
jgi:hypothetical protein